MLTRPSVERREPSVERREPTVERREPGSGLGGALKGRKSRPEGTRVHTERIHFAVQ